MKIEEPSKSYYVTLSEEEETAFKTVSKILDTLVDEMEDHECEFLLCADEYNYSLKRVKSVIACLEDLAQANKIYS